MKLIDFITLLKQLEKSPFKEFKLSAFKIKNYIIYFKELGLFIEIFENDFNPVFLNTIKLTKETKFIIINSFFKIFFEKRKISYV